MIIGAMNHPARDLLKEISWIAEMGFEFIDLTLEPPAAMATYIAVDAVRQLLDKHNLKVVGHTAYYLPLCSPFEPIRQAAVAELKECLSVFARLGAKWMNLHPDRTAPMHERQFVIQRNLESIRDLLPMASELGVGLMIENLPGSFNSPRQLGELLDAIPELGLHLDIGHANLLVDYNTTETILKSYGNRLRHVHLHDNKGGSADLHLPLGTGTLQLDRHIHQLQRASYDGTITLEVFTPDPRHLAYSREKLRKEWDAALTSNETHRSRVRS